MSVVHFIFIRSVYCIKQRGYCPDNKKLYTVPRLIVQSNYCVGWGISMGVHHIEQFGNPHGHLSIPAWFSR